MGAERVAKVRGEKAGGGWSGYGIREQLTLNSKPGERMAQPSFVGI